MWHHEIENGMRRYLEPRTSALTSAALLLMGGYLALSMLVAGQYILPQDRGVRQWVDPLRDGWLHVAMETVSVLGDAVGLVTMIVLASALLWRISRGWAVLLPALMAGTGALQYLTKWLADRPRPNDLPWGFPSGHVLSLTVFFGVIAYLVATRSCRRHRWRIATWASGGAIVLAVAFSRIYLDMHWLSDVVGGFSAGAAYLLLAITGCEVARRHASVERERATAAPALASAGHDDLGVAFAVQHLDGSSAAASGHAQLDF